MKFIPQPADVSRWIRSQAFWIGCVPAMVIVSMLSTSIAMYLSTRNPRLLSGEEKDFAIQAYVAAALADRVAENFDNPELREQAFITADAQIQAFKRQATGREAKRAVTVLEYYVKAVKTLPDIDTQCTIYRVSIDPARYQSSSTDALVRGTAPLIKCLTRRSEMDITARACRNEALSYISLARPPTDTCVYRWENPPTDRP